MGTGTWRWRYREGTVQLDARAADLLGLAGEPTVARSSAVRARLHPEDFVELSAVVALALAEGTVAEALLRVVGDDGKVLRVVRTRLRPRGDARVSELTGTVHEDPRYRDSGTGVLASAQNSPGREEWRRSREAFLLDAGRALAEATSTADVLRVAANLSMPGFSPDGLAVFGVDGERLVVVGHHGQTPGDEKQFAEMPLETDYPAALVIRSGRAVYLTSATAYQRRFPATWPLARPFGRNSWAFLPLVVSGHTIGAWMAAFEDPVTFTPDERAVLTTIARMLAQALERARVQESERALSDGLQRTMMPTAAPKVPGLAATVRYVPTGGGLQVGGDWYDVIALPGGRTAITIGDVQGHDVHAAGLMGQLRIALRAYASEGHRPDAVLARASRFLEGLDTERFATCLYLELDPLDGTVDIARAGHCEPCIRLRDGTWMVRQVAGGLPLGIADDDYPITRLVLEPREIMLLCTDGLLETGGHDIDSGHERLRRVLDAHGSDDLDELADALISTVHGPASHHAPGPLADRREDDIALMLLRREAADEVAPPSRRTVLTVPQAEPGRIAAARADVRATLRDWAVPELVDAAELLVSELLTNVLVHTDCDAVLTVELAGPGGRRRLRVEVGDRSDELPHRRDPGELASSGRGLLLMDELADAWGVEPRGEGKCTWFELSEGD